MKYIGRYPLEFVTLLVVVYFNIAVFFEPINLLKKIANFSISLLLFFVVASFTFAFREKVDDFREKLFSVFLSGEFQKSSILEKIYHLVRLSLIPFLVASIVELSLFVVLTDEGLIAFGFPFAVFSFSAGRFLPLGLLLNLLLFSSLMYFLGYILTREPNVEQK